MLRRKFRRILPLSRLHGVLGFRFLLTRFQPIDIGLDRAPARGSFSISWSTTPRSSSTLRSTR
jgi:hypothetical protein